MAPMVGGVRHFDMCAPSTADVRTVLMSAVDEAAIKYLHELLSEPNQTLITAAMRKIPE